MELEAQRKDEERQEEKEELKRFSMQKMSRRFSLFEQEWLISKTQEVIVEQYTKFAAAFQNTIQGYCVIYDQKK